MVASNHYTKFQIGNVDIVICLGDLLGQDVDAIICPSNSHNYMRGGLAGQIRARGGEEVEREARSKAPVSIGRAICTTGGKLFAPLVIHAPTMVQPVERTTPEGVRAATRAALSLAATLELQVIAFPGLGTGTGWLTYECAADSMAEEIVRFLREHPDKFSEIRLVARSPELMNAFQEALANQCNELD